MKRFELTFTFLKLPLDFIMILLGGFTAYGLRFSPLITNIRRIQFQNSLNWDKYWPIMMITAVGWLIILMLFGLYSANPNRKFLRDITKIISATLVGFASVTVYLVFSLQKFDSRFLLLAGWFFATAYLIGGRLILLLIKRIFYRLGAGLRRVVIIGQESTAQTIKEFLTGKPGLGYAIIANYDHFSPAYAESILKNRPDEIIFTDPRADFKATLSARNFATEHHITFKYSADLFDTVSSNMTISTLAGIPIVELRRTRLSGWGRIGKRLIDIIGAIFFLILFSPLFLIVAIGILIETGRPMIYHNERVGQRGKNFFTLKFRSMFQKYCTGEQFKENDAVALRTEAELIKKQNAKSGPVYKIANDPRVTRFGRFIRRLSLDEIPQFWNVLKGEMSLVGPRPHQPREVAKYEKHHKILFAVKPGVTGLAQISGRSNLTFEEEARLDTFYIENWSFLIDLIILVKTPFVVFRKKGAW